MKSSKYIDIPAINHVIGNIYKNPRLLAIEDKYVFNEFDFPSSFHKIVFSCLYNLFNTGIKNFSFEVLQDYFAQRPKSKAEFEVNKGYEYLLKVSEVTTEETFDYYYNRMKRMSLFRAYVDAGADLDWLYNPDLAISNTKKLQEQEDYIDTHSLEELSNAIQERFDNVKLQFVDDISDSGCQVGEGVEQLIESFSQTPALGYPLYGDYINTATRGARFGKFFLFSAATGIGKTRKMIAHSCNIGCSQKYDVKTNKWISTGASQPVLFIATEQDRDEVQSMCLAFLAGVDEEHILTNNYFTGEIERVQKAIQILKNSKIFFECMPDFTLKSIEGTIKRNIRENNVQYVFFDYIHSSASILMEVGGNKGVKGLREDNVLFLLASALKDIAVQYNIFMYSATQLNASYTESETPDQNLLRGSKAIADRIDFGAILMETTKEDKEKLAAFCTNNHFPMPNVKMSCYKNRQGRWKGIYMWMDANRAICDFNTIFVTDWSYNVIEMDNLKIKVEEEMAF